MRSTLLKRVAKLEAASVEGDVRLEELVLWSMRPASERRRENIEFAAFAKRCETSDLCRLIAASNSPAPDRGGIIKAS